MFKFPIGVNVLIGMGPVHSSLNFKNVTLNTLDIRVFKSLRPPSTFKVRDETSFDTAFLSNFLLPFCDSESDNKEKYVEIGHSVQGPASGFNLVWHLKLNGA